MKRLILLASGSLLLASANVPQPAGPGGDPAAAAYPPCSAKVTDRCVQSYERGVAVSRVATPHAAPAGESELSSVVAADAPPAAVAPPAAPPTRVAQAGYPRCTAALRDRCTQGHARRGYATAARRVQLAMRAGERG